MTIKYLRIYPLKPIVQIWVKYLVPKKETSVLGLSQFLQRGPMKGFLKWFGDAFAHAMGAIDAEEKSHVPPPIGMTPYRDQPMKTSHDY